MWFENDVTADCSCQVNRSHYSPLWIWPLLSGLLHWFQIRDNTDWSHFNHSQWSWWCWLLHGLHSKPCVRFYGNQPESQFTDFLVSLLLFPSCFLGVSFVFPVQSSRSSLRRSWSPRSTERGSSHSFHPGHCCRTYPLSKSAFPQCSSMKSTSGRLVLLCPPPQAPSGEERQR